MENKEKTVRLYCLYRDIGIGGIIVSRAVMMMLQFPT